LARFLLPFIHDELQKLIEENNQKKKAHNKQLSLKPPNAYH
jgi:hypothetical protein